MKKSKLLKLLNEIEGNPEILLWNSSVSDYHDISTKITDTIQYRKTPEAYLQDTLLREQVDRKDWEYTLTEEETTRAKKSYTTDCPWEADTYIDEDYPEEHRTRRVIYLDAVPRNKEIFDRMGRIGY